MHVSSLITCSCNFCVFIADQTPTPTRFLKNCEEVGLFSELPNPFDAEFRKASELQNAVSVYSAYNFKLAVTFLSPPLEKEGTMK